MRLKRANTTGLINGAGYLVRVIACDGTNTGEGQSKSTFTVVKAPAPQPTQTPQTSPTPSPSQPPQTSGCGIPGYQLESILTGVILSIVVILYFSRKNRTCAR